MKTLKEMLAEARAVVPEQGPAEVKKRIDAAEPLVLIDVRDPDEYRDGSIDPPPNISRGFLEFRIGGAAAGPTTPIVLYCQSGLRSMLAAKVLRDLGYQNVTNLQGGFQKWAQSGLPVVKDRPLQAEIGVPDVVHLADRKIKRLQLQTSSSKRKVRCNQRTSILPS